MIKLHALPLLASLFIANASQPQGNQPVKWLFKIAPISRNEIVLTAKVNLAPAWHLYSQFIEDGGPQPTRFIFDESSDYIRIGRIEEKGRQTKFYDDIYEMDIVWYADEVSFVQKIKLNQPVTVIKGKVDYMICNDAICIPHTLEFAVDAGSLLKNP